MELKPTKHIVVNYNFIHPMCMKHIVEIVFMIFNYNCKNVKMNFGYR